MVKNDGTKYEREICEILNSSHKTDSWPTNFRNVKGDKGVDIISYYKDKPLIIQCKDLAKKVGINHVRELNGIMPYNSNLFRIMVSKRGYTKYALDFKKMNKNLILTDGKNIIQDIKKHYDNYKNKIEKKDARVHKKIKRLTETNKKLRQLISQLQNDQ
ncbi:13421_t:CDS:2 [Funneliformis geosporum]|uniref:9122_t:CDS:1 n=1 Tax=Funneliformis geosporum TaxID=1117311 RepID=A0A9W4SD38_9GLOM|nr:9122_t:CDS:2 [Funneliformis geosporum]CAI2178864.1 13421_t:CDS:2 [Funneliformis geosporum]